VLASADIAGFARVDSIAAAGGTLYLASNSTGQNVVAALDGETLAETARTGWSADGQNAPLLLAGWPEGASRLAVLGLRPGRQPDSSSKRIGQSTGLATGDSLAIVVAGRKTTISVAADETLQGFVARINRALGAAGTARLTTADDGRRIRIEARSTQGIALLAGQPGADALAKLGLEPQRLAAPKLRDPRAPAVQPGGVFNLNLTDALALKDQAGAKQAQATLETASARLQSAYRSLYWDDGKAQIAAGAVRPAQTAYQAGRLSAYADALRRMGG
jgi:trimeric autotransporter adhesin